MVSCDPVSEPAPPTAAEPARGGAAGDARPPVWRSVAGTLGTSLALYRRRAGPLLLVSTIFVVPSVLVDLLERRASTAEPASQVAAVSAVPGGAPAVPTPAAPPRDGPSVAPASADAAAPVGDAALEQLSARDVFVRAAWVLIRAIFTSMLVAAVVREATLAVTGSPPAPGRSAGYGFGHVLGLGALGLLAASSAMLLLLLEMPLFFVLSSLQKGLPAGAAVAASFLLALPVALLFLTVAALAIPVFVVEGKRGVAALRRVGHLVKGEIRGVVATVAAVLLVGFAVGGLAVAAAAATGATLAAALAAEVLATPFEALVAFFLYLDLRSRKERLATATLQAELARNAP